MHIYNILNQFSDKHFTEEWFTKIKWENGKVKCPNCESLNVKDYKHPSMQYRCNICRKPISLKYGTKMHGSRAPLHIWTNAVAHDLINPYGISITHLSDELKISQNTTRSILNQSRKVLVSEDYPDEFIRGKHFRFNLIHHEVLLPNKHFKTKSSKKLFNSADYIVVCITEFNSDKIWVKTLPKKKFATIAKSIEKILPERAFIFANQSLFEQGIISKKFKLRDELAYDQMEIARLKKFGFDNDINVKSAGAELQNGLLKVYHKMIEEHFTYYVKVFAGRWNIRHLTLEKQMESVFTKLAKN